MNNESLFEALLHSGGYAAFEYLGDGEFRAIGEPPEFLKELFGEGVCSAPIRLGDSMPFLENFLVEAEQFWEARADRAESGAWVEKTADGHEIALEASALWLADKRILILRNPQERYEAEVEVLQKARNSSLEHERLLREIQKKEILLHCIIHDLSQPLTAMRGCFSILAMEKLAPKLRELVEVGRRQTQNQEAMIRGILEAFSSELAAQQTFHRDAKEAPDLVKCAGEIAKDFSAAFAERGGRIEVDRRLDRKRDWKVVGDESQLRRIYTNLVENALRYSPAGSSVTLGVEEEGPFLRACVDDQGPGLPKDKSGTHLFALFGKGKNSTGKAGLGLYFCKITVERWGGTIGCESRREGGSRFWFRVPRAQSGSARETDSTVGAISAAPNQRGAQAASPARQPTELSGKAESVPSPQARPKSPKRRAGRLRILLAEDTDVNRQLICLMLQRRGHSVVAAENGRQAIASLEKQPFDLVLMDVEMPEMGGLEATRAIREREQTTGVHIPIIAMTGHDTPGDRAQCLSAGMDAYLAKPISTEALYETVECVATGHSPASRSEPKEQATSESLDAASLLARVGGNAKLLRQLASAFLADCPKRMAVIHKAIRGRDAQALASAAHALKGSVSNFGAKELVEEARKLETMGRSGRLDAAEEVCAVLDEKIAQFEEALSALARRGAEKPSGPRKDTNQKVSGRRG